jgi:hypothetical protein
MLKLRAKNNNKTVRKPFVGALYERNRPLTDPFSGDVWGPPPRVTILSTDVTYFGCPGVLVFLAWTDRQGVHQEREVRHNLEQFLEQYHPVENIVGLKP